MAGGFSKGPKNPFYIDDATVIFPWFTGKETPMNRAGDRNFGLVLTKQQADELTAAGYNVKTRKALEANDDFEAREETYFITCKLGYNGRTPPRVILITCINDVCKRTPMDEGTIALLQGADITNVDCKISPYDREESDTRTAYVQNLYVTVELDKFDAKYDDIPWSDQPLETQPEDAVVD